MQLAADEIEELLSCLGPEPEDGVELRKFPRLSLSAPLVLRLLPGDARLQVRLRDISAEGMGILTTQRLMPGQQFVTNFARRDGSTFALLCQTKHCERGPDGVYSAGVCFVSQQNNQAAARKAG